jgi:queuine tRNA-ribosyltransferase
MLRLAGQLRESIIAGTYPAFREEFLTRYVPASEKMREEQREKWKQAAKTRQG